MNTAMNTSLKAEVEELAEQAFHQRLISGYGNGEFPNKFQIVYEGKPRHFSLEHARLFLNELLH